MTARLVGMIHLGALPGAPNFAGDIDGVLAAAVDDALVLAEAGFDGLFVENFGDAPFFADDVPKVTVAALSRAVATLRAAVDLPIGVNVLRNDGLAAIAVAAATGAQFVRINVLTGTMFTDQGVIEGRAAEVARARAELAPDLEIVADVFVKHGVPPPGLTLADVARETVARGGADVLVLTGTATGEPPKPDSLETVRNALPDTPVLVGSGLTSRNVVRYLEAADGVIVGTGIKKKGITTNPVDPNRAQAFVRAARRVETAKQKPGPRPPKKKGKGRPRKK